jgi:hypothetical protein
MIKDKCIGVIFLLLSSFVYAQSGSHFLLYAEPTFLVPIGPNLDENTAYYAIGGGISKKGATPLLERPEKPFRFEPSFEKPYY